ncbi:MCE family protein [Saccharopolyspora cebuensis]|uniref:MCE family protein n=1 Tax=Saccharopolyspora cebuensis TaxID=418759 RepID=A0ABV4CK22_9PSEU
MTTRIAAACCVLVLVVAGGWYVLRPAQALRVSADFAFADGIFPGNRVAVLGVPIGVVESVRPRGAAVRITMTVPPETELPADAHAHIMTPAVISDRYVELGPTHRDGPLLRDGAVIPLERTHAPIRWDRFSAAIAELLRAFEPAGGDGLGALLDTTARAVEGRGPDIRAAISGLARATDLVVAADDDIGAVLDDLDRLVGVLVDNQHAIDSLSAAAADAGAELADQRDELGAALEGMSRLLVEVDRLLERHGGRLSGDLDQLAGLSTTLAEHRRSLTEAVDTLPLALDNLGRTITPDERMRLRLNISTNLSQFDTTARLCERFPVPLCSGPGLVNPIPFPPELDSPLLTGGGR